MLPFDSNLLGPLCAFGTSITWAIGSAGYSQLSKSHSVFAVNFARGLVALPLFFIATFIISGGIHEGWNEFRALEPSHWGWFSLSMLASYSLGDSVFLWSTRSLGVPAALAIASCYPIWTLFYSYLFGSVPISILQVFGIFLSVAGIILVILDGARSKQSTRFSWKGVGLAFLASFAWATNSFAVSKGGVAISPSVGNTVRMFLALVLIAFFGKLFSPESTLFLPKVKIRQYLWLFVIEAFFGNYLYFYGFTHSALPVGATLASLAPVISVPLAWLIGREKQSWSKTLGVILVVVGVCFLVGWVS